MRQLLLAIFILATLQSNGQQREPFKFVGAETVKRFDLLIQFENFYAQVSKGSDTLEITSTGHIKFIKIGDRIYKIESPRLTEIESLIIWQPKAYGNVYYSVPMVPDIYDKMAADSIIKKIHKP